MPPPRTRRRHHSSVGVNVWSLLEWRRFGPQTHTANCHALKSVDITCLIQRMWMHEWLDVACAPHICRVTNRPNRKWHVDIKAWRHRPSVPHLIHCQKDLNQYSIYTPENALCLETLRSDDLQRYRTRGSFSRSVGSEWSRGGGATDGVGRGSASRN